MPDARIIMGWRRTRRSTQERAAELLDLSGELIAQLGLVTEISTRLVRARPATISQSRKFHPSIVWMAAT
jgi:hypothetical protein